MVKIKSLTLGDIVRDQNLEVIFLPDGAEKNLITKPHVSRNGMSLMGYHVLHHHDRIHIFGLREVGYLATLNDDERREKVRGMFAAGMPALILANNAGCDPILLEGAREYSVPLLRAAMRPSLFAQALYYYSSMKLAPTTYSHGVLVEVFGEGILILGESGIGKSETALELIKKTHRLVADDSVEISLMPDNRLIGRAPALTQHFIEIRGLGIINIRNLFGNSAVLNEVNITMVMKFVHWDAEQVYERLGLDEQVESILGVDLPLSIVPVRPGRNLAALVETEAINKRVKLYGYNAAEDLDNTLIHHMKQKGAGES